jgi:hypothetical protein
MMRKRKKFLPLGHRYKAELFMLQLGESNKRWGASSFIPLNNLSLGVTISSKKSVMGMANLFGKIEIIENNRDSIANQLITLEHQQGGILQSQNSAFFLLCFLYFIFHFSFLQKRFWIPDQVRDDKKYLSI